MATLVLFSGCSLMSKKAPQIEADWAFSGKMAIQNSTQATSFNLDWVQQNERFQIILSGPFGQGKISIKGQPGQVTLSKGGQEQSADNLNNLLYRATSMDLPLDYLQFWVRAETRPGKAAKVHRNEQGQVSQITQAGWSVQISDYFDAPLNQPRKLVFSNGGDRGKLIIRDWLPTSPLP
ncbi:lipoprotein insertase outer membrane protein LolB [Reinekea sp.]|uniref:lipoprotein insertase outer membrane protein LolB n=1 Tax=Reinekea sp. TaxID=1970455 RepID=UPI002A80A8C6|nr:lipoprotein insertase outer membrane protein LolB [Reinekea sp.]